ncbi:hypothetical protein P3T40_001025 [Paraburkholderia sp. EB58]|jgi:hypothetical protein
MWAPAVAAIGCASDSRQPEHEAVHGNGKGGCPQGQPPFFACGPRMKLKRGNGRYCYHHYYHLQHQHDLQQLHLRLTTYYCFTHQLLTTHYLLRTAYRIPQLHFATTATSTIYNAGTTTTHYNFIYDYCYFNHLQLRTTTTHYTFIYDYCHFNHLQHWNYNYSPHLHLQLLPLQPSTTQELQLPTTTSSTTATTTINYPHYFTTPSPASTTTTHCYHQLLQLPLLRNWMKRCAWDASKRVGQKGVPSSIDVMCRASEVTLQILDTGTNKSILKDGAPS